LKPARGLGTRTVRFASEDEAVAELEQVLRLALL
jgi:hypothetical protein